MSFAGAFAPDDLPARLRNAFLIQSYSPDGAYSRAERSVRAQAGLRHKSTVTMRHDGCRFLKDAELVTQENVVVETVEKAQEVTSTLFIDNCAVADEGEVKIVAENKAGTTSHVAKLTVVGKSYRSHFSQM